MEGAMGGLKARLRRPSPEQVAREITSRLRRKGDPVRARGARQYFKHQIVALGVTTPALRSFVRERVRELRGQWGAPQAIELCGRLLREPELEIRAAGILILGAFRKQLTPSLLKRAERWLNRRLDNWALVDGFCSAVLSPQLERHPEVEKTLNAWSDAESLWPRRAALVTLVPFARHGNFLNAAYRLAREHFADSEDLMHKATGWLLREAGKTDMPRLKRFLLKHGTAIPRTALRYAIERFPASERKKLLQSTRQPSNKRKIA
jgi:3-methyladenine DNA glycosylase AlkD